MRSAVSLALIACLTTTVPTKGEALLQVGPRRSKLVRFR